MIYSYSPNWYRTQCIYATDEYVFYASNYLLYRFNLEQKTVDLQLSFRQIAFQNALNYKDIKINCILFTTQHLFIGCNQPFIVIVDKSTLKFQKMIKLQNISSIEYLYSNSQQLIIIVDAQALLHQIHLQNYKIKLIPFQIKERDKVKLITRIACYHLVIYMKGTIIIFDTNFQSVIKNIQINQVILSVDVQKQQTIYLLSKSKQIYILSIFNLNLQFIGKLQNTSLESITYNFKRINMQLFYPKKCMQKLKHKKACLTIKCVDDRIILTGKLGQVYSIFHQLLTNNDHIIIRPFTIEQSKYYEMWADSKHYKEIYGIYKTSKYIFMVGIDHIMSVWFRNKDIKSKYCIKFMTTAAQNIFFSYADPQIIFLQLKDSIIRSCSPLQIGSHHLHEHWKFTNNYTIKKAVCHSTQVGILAMVTQCNKILIYDIYEDRLIKIFELKILSINSISFEDINIITQLSKMYNNEPQLIIIPFSSYFQKKLDPKVCLLLQITGYFYLITKIDEKSPIIFKIARDCKIERIHHTRYWDTFFLLSSQLKNNNLQIKIMYQGIFYQQILEQKQSRRYTFKAPKKVPQLYIIAYKSYNIAISKCQIGPKNIQIIFQRQIQLEYSIDLISLDYESLHFALYNNSDDIIQILNLQGQKQIEYYSINTKIECFCFYKSQYLIISSKDQAVKIIKFKENLHFYEHKNSKKNKKIQKNICKEAQKQIYLPVINQSIKKQLSEINLKSTLKQIKGKQMDKAKQFTNNSDL